MIQVTAHMKIMVALKPVDFRKRIDGLAAVCKLTLIENPFSGTLFVFRNKRCNSIRVLTYDGNGFWLTEKRLSKGKFSWWPSKNGDTLLSIDMQHIQTLFNGGDPVKATAAPIWKKLPSDN